MNTLVSTRSLLSKRSFLPHLALLVIAGADHGANQTWNSASGAALLCLYHCRRPLALCEIGVADLRLGRPSDARPCFERAAWVNPQFPDAAHNLRLMAGATP